MFEVEYSETCSCDHLYSETTSIQIPLGRVPIVALPCIFTSIKRPPLFKDHFFWPKRGRFIQASLYHDSPWHRKFTSIGSSFIHLMSSQSPPCECSTWTVCDSTPVHTLSCPKLAQLFLALGCLLLIMSATLQVTGSKDAV